MENKKLLNFILKDLIEIDELFSEKTDIEFDQLEIEFIQNRIKGAIKLVQIFKDREELTPITTTENKVSEPVIREQVVVEEVVEEEVIVEEKTIEEDIQENIEPEVIQEQVKDEVQEEKKEEIVETIEKSDDVELEEETAENPDKRLGDVFLKEKSVNDLLAATNNLENVLSNRPVKSIQSAIGINDRFQYIRELFEGKADDFVNAVEELDRMDNLKDAVQFLQVNYKWKKNDTSLKFVNIIKRRFAND